MTDSKVYTLYSPCKQELAIFVTYPDTNGIVSKVGIRYLSTIEGQYSKIIDHVEYSVQEAMMLVATARTVWYDLTSKGWNTLKEDTND
jgi:hypothetical protein